MGLMGFFTRIVSPLASFFDKNWYLAVGVPLFILVAFFHLWQLGDLPKGLYIDESSIGLNAVEIAHSGHDEYGYWMPVYFKAFGEYKNPLYVYLAAFVFKIFGVSEFYLRWTSFIFFYLFLIGFYLLTDRLFKSNKIIMTYGLIAAGFLPWFFPLSRIAFEVISQITVVIYVLLLVHKTYHDEAKNKKWLYPLLTGFLIGLSAYAYSTSRLLTFLMLLTLFIIYSLKRYWLTNLKVLVGFSFAILPLISFIYRNPNALMVRFEDFTYIFDSSRNLTERAGVFVTNYVSYLSQRFLLYTGDTNLRHHTGYGGELFVVVAILAVIGLVWVLITSHRKHGEARYNTFLLLSLFLSPIAAALTKDCGHALRTILLGLYILIFSLFGFSALLTVKNKHIRYTICVAIFLMLTMEACNYLQYYFTQYPQKTIKVFESYGFKEALEVALESRPNDVVISKLANQPYVHLKFYEKVLSIDNNTIPIRVEEPVAKDNRCIIFFPSDPTIINKDDYNSIPLVSKDAYAKLRCYHAKN